jgi:hypothetical protein
LIFVSVDATGAHDESLFAPRNDQAGLANALPEHATLTDLSDYGSMVRFVANAAPEHAPGQETHYHYLTFGWLVGGLTEAASGFPLQQVNLVFSPPVSSSLCCLSSCRDMPIKSLFVSLCANETLQTVKERITQALGIEVHLFSFPLSLLFLSLASSLSLFCSSLGIL